MYAYVCMQLKFGERVKSAITAFFRAHKHRWLIINFNVVFTCLTLSWAMKVSYFCVGEESFSLH